MATRTNWKELYQDLPENIASVLREKRVKPEQLTAKSDGEILAYGLSDTDLETIRSKYPAVSVEEAKPETKKEEVKEEAKKVSTSHFARFPRHVYGRSKRYQTLVKKIEKKALAPKEAVEKILALAGKDKNLDLHINTLETGLRGEVKTPFSTGKTVRVEIFSDKTVTALNENKIEFDILLATPADMPKLAKYAKLLGPKGLMPNPKSGTVTPNPEDRAKQLAAGSTVAYKTEPKFPIIHLSFGKTSQKADELTSNLLAILKEIGPTKIASAYLTSNQTPSVRLDLSSL